MEKLWKTLGAIIAVLFLLTGCGDGQADVNLGTVPMVEGIGVEGSGQSGDGQEGNGQSGDGQEGSGQSGNGQSSQLQSEERIKLTLGGLGHSDLPMMQYVVEAYNAQSEKYYVEVVDYLPEYWDNAIVEASEDRFRMALATGKGTDIVLYGGMAADELGHAGVVLDLNTFLTTEDKQERYMGDILECAQTGSALYEISPCFVLSFIVGDGSRIGMENGWTMEEMMDSFERNGRDGLALAKGQGRTVARMVESSMEDYVDWDTGKADFCKEEFYQILEFGKSVDNSEWIRPTRESVASGTHLASCEGLVTAADIQYLEWLFGDNMAVKGYPCSHGTGVAVSIAQDSMGICSYSQYPEGAWDFLEFYVGADWTDREFYAEDTMIQADFSHYFPGFPVNRRLFEEMLEQSMVQKYYQDTGEPYPLLQGEEGERPDFYANTAEDVRKLREVIALADRRYYGGRSVIGQIIEEEVGGYNSGAMTAEQTAEKIQNRVQLYLDEQK